MDTRRWSPAAMLAAGLLLAALPMAGCGSSGSDSEGTVSIALTDARPALPAGVSAVHLMIDEVEVHRAGGGWTSLPLAATPFTVDLLQFHDGQTTQLVPEVTLDAGRYDQLRLHVASARLGMEGGAEAAMTVPSDKVRTDRNFQVAASGAVALTVDFDLSQSIVAQGNGQFQLQPVIHLVETTQAAAIHGAIADTTFGTATGAEVVVFWDADENGSYSDGDQEYTRVVVPRAETGPTSFRVYWLLPDQGYTVRVKVGEAIVYEQFVAFSDVPSGADFALNGSADI